MHRDSCSTLSLAFIYDSFLLPIIPGTRAPRGSYEARRGGAEVGWHLICSMVVIYWMSANPDWMKNGARRRWGVPYSSLGGGKLPTSCPKNTPSFYIMPSFFFCLRDTPTTPSPRHRPLPPKHFKLQLTYGDSSTPPSPSAHDLPACRGTFSLFSPSIRFNRPRRSSQATAAWPAKPQHYWQQQNSINSFTRSAAAPV